MAVAEECCKMTGFYNQPQQGIVFIKSMEDLEKDAESRDYDSPFIFANYKVIDKTCNKELKYNVSLAKAETRKQKQLAYKKHAKCEVVIEELHLAENMKMTVRDIFGTPQYFQKLQDIRNAPCNMDTPRTKRYEMMGFSNNINLDGVVKSIISDKVINTRNGPTRMIVIEFEDDNDETINITIWGDMAEGIVEGCSLQIRKAEINTYGNQYSVNLQIPKYGSVKITNIPVVEIPKEVELPKDGLVMTLKFKPKGLLNFLEYVTPQIRQEDKIFTDFVNDSITLRNPTRYERFDGMKITELGSIPKEPRSKRIEKLEGVMKDNFVTVGVLNDGPYGTKGTVLKENFAYAVVKDDESKDLSYMDKYSYKCGQCDEKYGYQRDAEECSKKHIPWGKMLGDYVKFVEIKKDE